MIWLDALDLVQGPRAEPRAFVERAVLVPLEGVQRHTGRLDERDDPVATILGDLLQGPHPHADVRVPPEHDRPEAFRSPSGRSGGSPRTLWLRRTCRVGRTCPGRGLSAPVGAVVAVAHSVVPGAQRRPRPRPGDRFRCPSASPPGLVHPGAVGPGFVTSGAATAPGSTSAYAACCATVAALACRASESATPATQTSTRSTARGHRMSARTTLRRSPRAWGGRCALESARRVAVGWWKGFSTHR